MFENSHPIATLPVTDLDRAMSWYSDKLGLAPATVIEGEGAFYQTERATFALYPSAQAGQNPSTAAAFLVEDVDAAVQHLRRVGVRFEEFDLGDQTMTDGVLTLNSGAKGAWFKDSEGNILAVSDRQS